jgi:hypothetical protein
LSAGLARLRTGRATVRGATAVVELNDPDPRAFFAELAGADLPPIAGVEHGQTSLEHLYRDLYGVEAV